MENLIKISADLSSNCIQQANLLSLSPDLIGYQAEIATLSQIFQHLLLERPDYLIHASTKRLNEFFAGRILAQAILKQHFDCSIGITSEQSKLPLWPQGLIGSISHSDDLVIVAISSHSEYLGIDIERIVETSFAEESAALILTPFEQSLWQTEISQALNFCEYLTLIFSLKESLYKAVYPVAQNYIDFLEAEMVEMNLTKQSVMLKFDQKIMRRYGLRHEYCGFWQFNNDSVITYVVQSNEF
ncbi:4'-phosphopantetheinyl transferase family protein [Acinetobacter colistiniresistens]|uniref:Enterobactin synthase component D n=1 Tax=Acinetobacter colistiniresistens TaxID=280145 RepID=A0A558F822_9GAMM|nr:4'-phosphopantetheinyl transferase superfamily protein [Acinetobacter colistiniresistens]TVT81648.1 4'-phosphopantetheinyl transferase superfamily protein [Acinetobacter colistiniresistens]